MPINIVCPGCRKRFAVSEKFAGQQGPCPNCKTAISIPKQEDEVVVHAPEDFGVAKDSSGKKVIEPILREETRFSAKWTVVIVVGVIAVFAMAFVVGRSSDEDVPRLLQGLVAIVIAPLLVIAGYSFLRNDELEPYRGWQLALRVAACALVYAFLWGAYAWVQAQLGIDVEAYQLVFVAPPVLLIGAFAALTSLDLDFTSGMIHYGMYLIVTVLLRWVAGMSPF
jgi:chromate transport protein ChrA